VKKLFLSLGFLFVTTSVLASGSNVQLLADVMFELRGIDRSELSKKSAQALDNALSGLKELKTKFVTLTNLESGLYLSPGGRHCASRIAFNPTNSQIVMTQLNDPSWDKEEVSNDFCNKYVTHRYDCKVIDSLTICNSNKELEEIEIINETNFIVKAPPWRFWIKDVPYHKSASQ
jgi:hypothetical protein